MSTQYLYQRDLSGTINSLSANVFCALDGESTLLAANVEQHFIVPNTAKYWIAVIAVSNGGTVYFDGINTAVVPGSSFAASTMEIIPPTGLSRAVLSGQTLSFITADTGGAHVTIKLYVCNTYTNNI